MQYLVKKLISPLAVALVLSGIAYPGGTRAQTYPIDCAILLCLSGGWPASAPCTLARAEFIRRITPWPIEPPLQIWRCPLGASHEIDPQRGVRQRILDAAFRSTGQRGPDSAFAQGLVFERPPVRPVSRDLSSDAENFEKFALRLIRNGADIDISGPEFDFVRSIRVFNVRYARQSESESTGDCNRSQYVVLGTYGPQGGFSWQPSSSSALPSAHFGLERFGQHCPKIDHRSVFVEWRDFAGRYGFEQVDY